MKRRLVMALGMLPWLAMALVSGEKGEALTNLDYVKGEPVYLDKNSYSGKEPFANLRVVTIFATFLPDAGSKLALMDEISREYRERDLEVVAVSPQPKEAVGQLTGALKLENLSVAVDPDGKITNAYLDGALVSSRSFIVDADRTIIWDGDSDDVPRILERIYTGDFNPLNFRPVSGWQQELTLAIAAGDLKSIMAASDRILRADPENSMAIRGYLYSAQYLATPEQTFDYFAAMKKLNPDNPKTYWAMLTQCQADQNLAGRAWAVIDEFGNRFASETSEINRMAWAVLNSFPMSADGLLSASKLAAILEKAAPSPEILTTLALYRSRIGRLDAALELQKQAVELAPAADKPVLDGFTAFYEQALRQGK